MAVGGAGADRGGIPVVVACAAGGEDAGVRVLAGGDGGGVMEELKVEAEKAKAESAELRARG